MTLPSVLLFFCDSGHIFNKSKNNEGLQKATVAAGNLLLYR